MKTTLLSVLLLITAVSVFATAHSNTTPAGYWTDISDAPICGTGRACANWSEPGGGENGATCCVDRRLIPLNDFRHCQLRLWGPRDPEGGLATGSTATGQDRDRRPQQDR